LRGILRAARNGMVAESVTLLVPTLRNDFAVFARHAGALPAPYQASMRVEAVVEAANQFHTLSQVVAMRESCANGTEGFVLSTKEALQVLDECIAAGHDISSRDGEPIGGDDCSLGGADYSGDSQSEGDYEGEDGDESEYESSDESFIGSDEESEEGARCEVCVQAELRQVIDAMRKKDPRPLLPNPQIDSSQERPPGCLCQFTSQAADVA